MRHHEGLVSLKRPKSEVLPNIRCSSTCCNARHGAPYEGSRAAKGLWICHQVSSSAFMILAASGVPRALHVDEAFSTGEGDSLKSKWVAASDATVVSHAQRHDVRRPRRDSIPRHSRCRREEPRQASWTLRLPKLMTPRRPTLFGGICGKTPSFMIRAAQDEVAFTGTYDGATVSELARHFTELRRVSPHLPSGTHRSPCVHSVSTSQHICVAYLSFSVRSRKWRSVTCWRGCSGFRRRKHASAPIHLSLTSCHSPTCSHMCSRA